MDNSSSRSPDSSTPYTANLEVPRNQFQTSGNTVVDYHISSTTGNNAYHYSVFESLARDVRNSPNPERLPRAQDYQSNERSVINFATTRSNDLEDSMRPDGIRFDGPTPENASRRSDNSFGRNDSNFCVINGFFPRPPAHLFQSLPNYQTSSVSSSTGIYSVINTTANQSQVGHGPHSYTLSNIPYVPSGSCASTTTSTNSIPKTEHSYSSSCTTRPNSSFLSLLSSQPTIGNIKQESSVCVVPIIPPTPISSLNISFKQNRNLNTQQQGESAKTSDEARGIKRKSSRNLNNSDHLLSAPSSSTNYANNEQNVSRNSKKNKVRGSSPILNVEDVDDDIQILTPETTREMPNNTNPSGLESSPSYLNNLSREVSNLFQELQQFSSDDSRSNSTSTAAQSISEPIRNLSPQESSTREVSVIHRPSEIEQLLDGLWADPHEFADITIPPAAVPTAETNTISLDSDSDDSSSSSVELIQEVLEVNSSFDAKDSPSHILEKVPNNIPSVITIEDSPKNDELMELKIKQEADNVKEDFKKLLEDELICNICTELLIKPVTLGCSHTFCKFCISEWKEKKNQCPMCRAVIKTETPCLFLDNFISKAVEQLEPESVEKRSEIIKSRENLLKSKEKKVLNHPHVLSLGRSGANLIYNYQTDLHRINVLQQPSHPTEVFNPFYRQQASMPLRSSFNLHRDGMLQRTFSSNSPRSLDIDISVLPSSVPTRISVVGSRAPQPPSSVPQQHLSMPQQSPSISQQSSSLHQGNTSSFAPASAMNLLHRNTLF